MAKDIGIGGSLGASAGGKKKKKDKTVANTGGSGGRLHERDKGHDPTPVSHYTESPYTNKKQAKYKKQGGDILSPQAVAKIRVPKVKPIKVPTVPTVGEQLDKAGRSRADQWMEKYILRGTDTPDRLLTPEERVETVSTWTWDKLPPDIEIALADQNLSPEDMKAVSQELALRFNLPVEYWAQRLTDERLPKGQTFFQDPKTGQPMTMKYAMNIADKHETMVWEAFFRGLQENAKTKGRGGKGTYNPSEAPLVAGALRMISSNVDTERMDVDWAIGISMGIAHDFGTSKAKWQTFGKNMQMLSQFNPDWEPEKTVAMAHQGAQMHLWVKNGADAAQFRIMANSSLTQKERELALTELYRVQQGISGNHVPEDKAGLLERVWEGLTRSEQYDTERVNTPLYVMRDGHRVINPAAFPMLEEGDLEKIRFLTGEPLAYYDDIMREVHETYQNDSITRYARQQVAEAVTPWPVRMVGGWGLEALQSAEYVANQMMATVYMGVGTVKGMIAAGLKDNVDMEDVYKWQKDKQRVIEDFAAPWEGDGFMETSLADLLISDGAPPVAAEILEIVPQIWIDPLVAVGALQKGRILDKIITVAAKSKGAETTIEEVRNYIYMPNKVFGKSLGGESRSWVRFMIDATDEALASGKASFNVVFDGYMDRIKSYRGPRALGIDPAISDDIAGTVATLRRNGASEKVIEDTVGEMLEIAAGLKPRATWLDALTEGLNAGRARRAAVRAQAKATGQAVEEIVPDQLERVFVGTGSSELDNTVRKYWEDVVNLGGAGTNPTPIHGKRAIYEIPHRGIKGFKPARTVIEGVDNLLSRFAPELQLKIRSGLSTLPSLILDIENTHVDDYVRQLLRRGGVADETQISNLAHRALNIARAGTRRREKLFRQFVDEINELTVNNSLIKHGVSLDDPEAFKLVRLLQQKAKEKTALLFGVDADSFDQLLGQIDSPDVAAAIRQPVWEGQLVNKWAMLDPMEVDRLIGAHLGLGQNLRNGFLEAIGKTKHAKVHNVTNMAVLTKFSDAMERELLRRWKVAVVATPRYILRVPLFDEQLRFFADLTVMDRYFSSRMHSRIARKLPGVNHQYHETRIPIMQNEAVLEDVANVGIKDPVEAVRRLKIEQQTGVVDEDLARLTAPTRQLLEDTLNGADSLPATTVYGFDREAFVDEYVRMRKELFNAETRAPGTVETKSLKARFQQYDGNGVLGMEERAMMQMDDPAETAEKIYDALLEKANDPNVVDPHIGAPADYHYAFGPRNRFGTSPNQQFAYNASGNTVDPGNDIWVDLGMFKNPDRSHTMNWLKYMFGSGAKAEDAKAAGIITGPISSEAVLAKLGKYNRQNMIAMTIDHENGHTAWQFVRNDLTDDFARSLQDDGFSGINDLFAKETAETARIQRLLNSTDPHTRQLGLDLQKNRVYGPGKTDLETHEWFADVWAVYKQDPEILTEMGFSEVRTFMENNADRIDKVIRGKKTRVHYVDPEMPNPKELVVQTPISRPGDYLDDMGSNSGAASDFFESARLKEETVRGSIARGTKMSPHYYGEIMPGDPRYLDTLEKVLRNDIRRSVHGRMILEGIERGKSVRRNYNEVMEYFDTPTGRRALERMGWRKEDMAEKMEGLVESVHRWTNSDPQIAEAILNRRKEARAMIEAAAPNHPVHGFAVREVVSDNHPVSKLWSMWTRGILEIPTNRLARQPFFKAWKAKVYEGYLDLAEAQGIDILDKEVIRSIDGAADEFARQRVLDVMFDFRKQYKFAEMSRWVAPFMQPWMEAFTVWGALVRRNPAFAMRATIIGRTMVEKGFFEKDDVTGEYRFPLTQFLMAGPLLNTIFGGGEGLPDTPGWSLSGPVRSFNFFFGSIYNLPVGDGSIPIPTPGSSPPMTWLAQKFADSDLLPEWAKYPTMQWAYEYGSVEDPTDLAQSLLPTFLSRLVDSNADEDMVNSTAVDFLRLYQARGMTAESVAKSRDITVAEAEKFLANKATADARNLIRWRALFSWLMPVAPSVDFPTAELEDEFRSMVDKNDDFLAGVQEFEAKYGDKYDYLTQPSTVWLKAGGMVPIPASEAVERLMMEPQFEAFARKYPRWAFALIPQEHWDDPFERSVFFRQMDEGWRRAKGPLEFIQDNDTVDGWEAYFAMRESYDTVDTELDTEGLSETDVPRLGEGEAADEEIENLKQLFPAWAEEYNTINVQGIDPYILKEAQGMIHVPAFAKTEVGKGLKAYLLLRKQVENKMAPHNIQTLGTGTSEDLGIDEFYSTELQSIIAQYPQFERVHTLMFRNDFKHEGLVETKGEKWLSDNYNQWSDKHKQRYIDWNIEFKELQNRADEAADNPGEAAAAYIDLRRMTQQQWDQAKGWNDNNYLKGYWETRQPDDIITTERSVSLRPFVFMSRFDREVVLGIKTDTKTEEQWLELGDYMAETSRLNANNPGMDLGHRYDKQNQMARRMAKGNKVFKQQLAYANEWGWAYAHANKKMLESDTPRGEAWRSFYDHLGHLQHEMIRRDIHSVESPDPKEAAAVEMLRLRMERAIEDLKRESNQFKRDWEALNEGSGYALDKFFPPTWFELGGHF